MDGRHGQNQGHEPGEATQSTADMTAFVQNLLQQMQTRFQTMSDSIITKIDEMGSRIDELERSIGELTKEMGVEVSQANALPPSSTQSGTPK
ncbi:heat shock factor-binding protein [Cryptomeria japonica]|uniref:heat shock factor-binding protein n=1 Tax=Cryptomeria japonica TaxID=3369 RepID=UPI0025ABE185|nr:heat shock factor-binding protein [Cryptomeria japonica]